MWSLQMQWEPSRQDCRKSNVGEGIFDYSSNHVIRTHIIQIIDFETPRGFGLHEFNCIWHCNWVPIQQKLTPSVLLFSVFAGWEVWTKKFSCKILKFSPKWYTKLCNSVDQFRYKVKFSISLKKKTTKKRLWQRVKTSKITAVVSRGCVLGTTQPEYTRYLNLWR